ncbi:uncharacterized protein LOC142974349 [Anticarsia gemmatalis]|uniref:uncharacterized protein LOC142974349 n=1 Tax=Anticarsia gemmatalis TaxID=129554 RepID=UPI003F7764E3
MRKSSKMLIHCGLLLLFLNCVRTTEYVDSNGALNDRVAEFNKRFSWWPSVHNAASLVRVRRQAEQAVVKGVSEGGTEVVDSKSQPLSPSPTTPPAAVDNKNVTKETKTEPTVAPAAVPAAPPANITVTVPPLNATAEAAKSNSTVEKTAKQLDLNNPGVLKRGFIVFGGFALLAVAYFIFYRRKGKNNDTGNTHNTNDANQFRYGVLQSEDRRDNLELSRVPLTMESDDDEDEDLEIFDLEQKKKSLSYVNLQTNDEDIVFSHNSSTNNDRENLLLDIEDGTSETLINWSSSGSKSIL